MPGRMQEMTRKLMVQRLLGYAVLAWSLLFLSGTFARAATFGTVVQIGGHPSDLAFDSRRGRLYIANFGAMRIDVMDTGSNALLEPIRVAEAPDTLALSPDGRFLLVGHYQDGVGQPSVTVLDLDAGLRRSVVLGSSPLALAFGSSPLALIVTKTSFHLLDPLTGDLQTLELESNLTTDPLPVPFATYPPEIIQASAGVSGDGQVIYVLAQGSGSAAVVMYVVPTGALSLIGVTASPELGPRLVSVNQDGSRFLAGWALLDPQITDWAQFPRATGALQTGSHAYDNLRNLIYAQVPSATAATGEGPVLEVADTDNLTIRERLRLKENLAGKSVFGADMQVLYAASDSGVTVLPVGSLFNAKRVVASQEDVLFRTAACDTTAISKEIDIVDPGGGIVDFTITGAPAGVRVIPSSGLTPARVRIEVDPSVFQNVKGTTVVPLQLTSTSAVNIPPPIRVLINTHDPEQRGTILNVPGKLVDVLADPVRNRFYVLRQDKNLMLVFDGTTFQQIAALRTGNTPVQMAMSQDLRYMIVGNDNSQIANVYDLETLEASTPILFPAGHYPRSIAVSDRSILATVRSASGPSTIDRIDFPARVANTLPRLGIYNNEIDANMVLSASPDRQLIFGAMPDGTVLLYEVNADVVIASRHDVNSLSGAYAAVRSDVFVAGNNVFNSSLVPSYELDSSTGESSGFVFYGGSGLRTSTPSISGPGIIERVNLDTLQPVSPTKMIESPLLATSLATPPVGQIGETILPFTRTLAPLSNGQTIISLSVSGFTALPWDFDQGVAPPVIGQVVNSADLTPPVASGGLITIYGSSFSPISEVAGGFPLPTALGEACVTVNNMLIPLSRVSATEIAGQLPYGISGSASMIVRGPGGASAPFAFTVFSGAPAIFRTGTAGPDTGLATVYRATNDKLTTLSNPIHPEDVIVIYLTGLGATVPSIEAGEAAPYDPLAQAASTPQVTLAGVNLPVEFAGLVPGMAGVYQINASVPYWIPTGLDKALTITQGGQSTTLLLRIVK